MRKNNILFLIHSIAFLTFTLSMICTVLKYFLYIARLEIFSRIPSREPLNTSSKHQMCYLYIYKLTYY